MKEKFRIDFHWVFPFLLTLVLWIVFYLDKTHQWELSQYGIWPRSVKGLPGILVHFFVHGNYHHILSNTLSFLVLSLLLFVSYREIAFKVLFLMIPMTGLGIWLIGRGIEHGTELSHIGASGVIFSIFGFLLVSGMIRKNKMSMAVSALVIFLYGYMVWGIFPRESHISWEGHLSGLISGVLLSVLFRNKGPQPDRFVLLEKEEEENEEVADAYWMQGADEKENENESTPVQKEKNDVIFVTYNFIPEKPKDGEKENKD